MRYCANCGGQVEVTAIECPHCGSPQIPHDKSAAGKPDKKQTVFGCLIMILGLLAIACFITLFTMANDQTPEEDARSTIQSIVETSLVNTPTPAITATVTPEPTVDPAIALLIQWTPLNIEGAREALEVIYSSGFKKIKAIDKLDTENYYIVKSDIGNFTAEIRKDGLYKILWNWDVLYDVERDIREIATPHVLTEEEKAGYQKWVIDNVKHNLENPSSANFGYPWEFYSDTVLVTVYTAFDTKVESGSEVVHTVTAQFQYSTGKVVYFAMSDTVIYDVRKTR